MATKTQRELLQAALEARGWEIDRQRTTGKYVAMRPVAPEKPETGERRYFIGKSGGLRFGRIISSSFSAMENTRQRLLKEGAKILG